MAKQDVLRLTNNYEFDLVDEIGHDILTCKTVMAKAAIDVATQVMDIVGGAG